MNTSLPIFVFISPTVPSIQQGDAQSYIRGTRLRHRTPLLLPKIEIKVPRVTNSVLGGKKPQTQVQVH